MRIVRVFPRRTSMTPNDALAFIGDPPLFRPEADEVHVSVTFAWDIHEAQRLVSAWSQYYPGRVRLGGPALGHPGGEFTTGRYLRPGVTITSRGCPNRCGFCFVPRREGKLRLLPINPGNIIQDNNILACPRHHVEAVFEMLQGQRAVRFAGGLEAARLRPWHVKAFERLSVAEFWFAADTDKALRSLERAAGLMGGHYTRNKMRCYVLIGHGGEKIGQAEMRLMRIWELGFLPFAQLYRGPGEQEYSENWKKLRRIWSRPAATVSHMTREKRASNA